MREGSRPEPTYLVLGIEDNSLCMGHTDHVVVKASSGQPDSGREFMVQQRELRDQPLCFLLFSGECGQPFADCHQGFDEFSFRSQPDRLQTVGMKQKMVKKTLKTATLFAPGQGPGI